MKTSRLFWMAVFFVAAGLLHNAPALGQSASCYILANMEKTRIFVRELDQDSNPLGELGSGWVNQGDQAPIISRTGRISISYQLSSSDKSFMKDPTSCSDGVVISVP
jgi:hypothetical protein